MRQETYYYKKIHLEKQYKLFDDYLTHPDTVLSFEDRMKLINEMGRILKQIEYINNLTLLESKKITDDYNIKITSPLNEKILPIRL